MPPGAREFVQLVQEKPSIDVPVLLSDVAVARAIRVVFLVFLTQIVVGAVAEGRLFGVFTPAEQNLRLSIARFVTDRLEAGANM